MPTFPHGGRVEALKWALGANAAHGHRRSNADKRRAVEIALREFPKILSNALAKMCGVHDGLVASVRGIQVPESGTSTVTGADGKQYPTRRFDALHSAVLSMSNAGDIGGSPTTCAGPMSYQG